MVGKKAIQVAKKSKLGVNKKKAEKKGKKVIFITNIDEDQSLQWEFILQEDFVPFGNNSDG